MKNGNTKKKRVGHQEVKRKSEICVSELRGTGYKNLNLTVDTQQCYKLSRMDTRISASQQHHYHG